MHLIAQSLVYRMKKIQEVAGYDLGDPDERLHYILSLALLRHSQVP